MHLLKPSTKRAPRVKELLYSTFRGNCATKYGLTNENETRKAYVEKMQATHPSLVTLRVGLVISTTHPWIAASPDDLVTDPSAPNPYGVAEYKTPPSAKGLTIAAACDSLSNFCLKDNTTSDSYFVQAGNGAILHYPLRQTATLSVVMQIESYGQGSFQSWSHSTSMPSFQSWLILCFIMEASENLLITDLIFIHNSDSNNCPPSTCALRIHFVQITSLRECLAWFLGLCVCDCLNWIGQ